MTKVYLTDFGKEWLKNNYKQGIVYEYDVEKPFELHSISAKYVTITQIGIPYTIPNYINDKITFKSEKEV